MKKTQKIKIKLNIGTAVKIFVDQTKLREWNPWHREQSIEPNALYSYIIDFVFF